MPCRAPRSGRDSPYFASDRSITATNPNRRMTADDLFDFRRVDPFAAGLDQVLRSPADRILPRSSILARSPRRSSLSSRASAGLEITVHDVANSFTFRGRPRRVAAARRLHVRQLEVETHHGRSRGACADRPRPAAQRSRGKARSCPSWSAHGPQSILHPPNSASWQLERR